MKKHDTLFEKKVFEVVGGGANENYCFETIHSVRNVQKMICEDPFYDSHS